MDKIQKIRQEIERRMDKHWEGLPDADSPEDDWTHNELCELGAYKELEHIEDFLNSLLQEQPIQINTLTWKDINDIERIINNVHYEFRNGIGEKSFGEEVIERLMEEKDEQEQPEVDLEKEIKNKRRTMLLDLFGPMNGEQSLAIKNFARHFYELGFKARKEE